MALFEKDAGRYSLTGESMVEVDFESLMGLLGCFLPCAYGEM